MSKTLKAVIFDVDGTMIPNTPYHQQAFVELGNLYNIKITPEDYHRRFHARTNSEIIKDIFGQDLSSEQILYYSNVKEELYRKIYTPHLREVAGLKNMICDLVNQGIVCAAASNGPRTNVDLAIECLGLKDILKFSLSFEDVKNGKPAPDLFLKAASMLNVLPEHCLVFEDSKPGFKAAEAANMHYIAIASEHNQADLPAAKNSLAIVENFSLLDFAKLNNLFGQE